MTPRPGPASGQHRLRLDQRPILVFWETTRACPLACRHCRAAASRESLPGELSNAQGRRLIDQIAGFGAPAPVLVLTGGDCLLRSDLFELIGHATAGGLPVALAPAVSPLLSAATIEQIAASGVRAVSISLDGAEAATHDGIRGIPGHHAETLAAIRALAEAGVTVQVNTTVMRGNVGQLADVFHDVVAAGAQIWEVFFLIGVGRGETAEAVTASEHEQVCHFLYDAAGHDRVVRAVEAPFLRRVAASRDAGSPPTGHLYQALTGRLRQLLGQGTGQPGIRSAATRDGKGIVFVGYDGQVYPAGFLPLPLGNIQERPLAEIYRDHPLLRSIRAAEFSGRCGRCEYADLCGGSRARAYASTGDPLGDDPACEHLCR